MGEKDVLDIKEINKDLVFAQLRNLVDPLFLSKETLQHIEQYFPFDKIQKKTSQGTISRNDISDFVIAFARALREDVKAAGRTVIETNDIDAAFTKVKARAPFD